MTERLMKVCGLLAGLSSVVLLVSALAQQPDPLAEPFKGVTTNGAVLPGLYPLRARGVSTGPVREAARRFLASLSAEERAQTTFPVDDTEWRNWNNIHRYARQGLSFKAMTEKQRELAFDLMRAGLSAKGLEKSRNIMRLNGHLAELVGKLEEYGEYLYWLTVMGEPSKSEPWGWQLDGHHLVINYFVLGDQVVMTPTFMGSEPVIAESGKYAGTAVLQDEQGKGLALLESLDPDQRRVAVIETEKVRNNALAQAFRDNLVLDYAGIRGSALNETQRKLLIALIEEYFSNIDSGHAAVRMDEVQKHIAQTYFAWIGGTDVFYYRVQSPVILIEFDHQTPVALPGPRVPNRKHVHSVVRTPNGNDYGKDLLRQHYEANRTNPSHGHSY